VRRGGTPTGSAQHTASEKPSSSYSSTKIGSKTSPILLETLTPPLEVELAAPLDDGVTQPASLPDMEWQVVQRTRKTTAHNDPPRTLIMDTFNIFDKGLWGTILPSPKHKTRKTPQKKALKMVVTSQPVQTATATATRTRPQRTPPLSYAAQLETARAPEQKQIPLSTPPPPPRYTLNDPTSIQDSLFVAPSRLGYRLEGVFPINDIPMDRRHPPVLCEFREKGATRVGKMEHIAYLKSLIDHKEVVIRGNLLVDGTGNANSYCTRIQENLNHAHYNCAYKYMNGMINVVQILAIKANEELSIQYTSNGEYWKHREDYYPWQLYAMACARYGLPIPVPPEPPPLPSLGKFHLLVSPPKPSSDNLLEHRYHYSWPIDTPVCRLRISTLNVNGSLHDMTVDTAIFASFNGTSTTKPSLIDHIFLQAHPSFKLTSIGGTMHLQLSDVTDHNEWPETPPSLRKYSRSTRITNNPDLPTDKATIQKFKDNLDSMVEN
jgi:hypothetical protein